MSKHHPNIGNLPFSDTSDSDNSQENTTAAQENSTTDIATTSAQENPTTDENVEPPPNFVVKLNQARTLKFAIEALCDPAINPLGFGRIDVDVNGFNVTVENNDRNVVGHLFLKPSDFFLCNKPTEPGGMIVNLRELYQHLTRFIDDDPIRCFHDDGINKLYCSTVGIEAWSTYCCFVESLENHAAIPKFPELSSISYARVPSKDLSSMLEDLLFRQAPYQVTVEMMENTATLKAGHDEDGWRGHYTMVMGVEPGERYRASFEWTRAVWLNQARQIETSLAVGHTEQPTYIVWKFFIDGGYLEYVKEPVP